MLLAFYKKWFNMGSYGILRGVQKLLSSYCSSTVAVVLEQSIFLVQKKGKQILKHSKSAIQLLSTANQN